MAGHWTGPDGLRVDTHGEAICDEVYDLLEYTLGLTGPRPVLLERDQNFPPWGELVTEIRRLDGILRRAASRVLPAATDGARDVPLTSESLP